MIYRQPDLVGTVFRLPFHGRAETVTGDVWWYEEDGKRFALRPAAVAPTSPAHVPPRQP